MMLGLPVVFAVVLTQAPAPARAGFGLQSLNPDISLVTDIAAAVFSSEENFQTGAHDPRKSGFNLQQLELAVGAAVDPYFRFDSNIVFAEEDGEVKVEVEEVYATTLALPAGVQMRAGQFLTRFGRLNHTHPHTWAFADQPFALGRVFGADGNHGLGVEASWLMPLPWFLELVGSATDAAGEETARSFLGAEDVEVKSPLDFQLTGAVKQFHELRDDLSLFWGLSAANGPNPTGENKRTTIYGADVYLKYRPLTEGSTTQVSFQGEVFYRRRRIPDALLTDWSGYGQLFWRFAQRWGAAARYELGSPAEGGIDPLDPEWTSFRHRVSANVTFWPTEFSRLRLQGSADVPTFEEAPVYAVFLAFEFSVGAHGAHAF